MSDVPIPPPVPRLDPESLIERINAATGVGLRLTGRAGQGEVGAALIEWPGGERGVLTRTRATIADLPRTQSMLERVAKAGLPVPRYPLLVDVGVDRVVIQERLPGDSPAVITGELVARMLALLDDCAGLGKADDVSPMELYLTSSGPGVCEHETLQAYDHRTRRLLTRIHQIGGDSPSSEPGEDLVHLDFHFGKVLVRGRAITGLVDWDGYGRVTVAWPW